MQLDAARRADYLKAYERWQYDLQAVHRVLLDGEQMDPLHFVPLLRRESKSKEKYDEARETALGLPGGEESDDPFGETGKG